MGASEFDDQSFWETISAMITRCPVEGSSTEDFKYDCGMKWDYSVYQILEDISEKSDINLENSVTSLDSNLTE